MARNGRFSKSSLNDRKRGLGVCHLESRSQSPFAKKRGRSDFLWIGELQLDGVLLVLICRRKPGLAGPS
jgi:hypothetical protein